MTIEKLRHMRALTLRIKNLSKEIEMQYDTYHSPDTSQVRCRTTGGPSSVEKAVFRIDGLQKKLEELNRERLDLVFEIEDWMTEIEKSEPSGYQIGSIIRWYFIIGKSWKETSRFIYGKNSADLCRVTVNRFFEKHVSGMSEVIKRGMDDTE